MDSGDEVAVELEWTGVAGVLAVPVLGLSAGSEMKAFVAMFLTFRDGRIVSQRNLRLLSAVCCGRVRLGGDAHWQGTKASFGRQRRPAPVRHRWNAVPLKDFASEF
jgi:hypothetical protein